MLLGGLISSFRSGSQNMVGESRLGRSTADRVVNFFSLRRDCTVIGIKDCARAETADKVRQREVCSVKEG